MEIERSLHLPQPLPMETEQQQPILTLQQETENTVTADTAAPPLLDIHTNVVQGLCSLGFIREQLHKQPEPESFSQDTVSPSLSTIHKRVVHAICSLGFNSNVNMFNLQDH